jgi:Arc/MetJ-type ribon-helix-helix transcriptional regulator
MTLELPTEIEAFVKTAVSDGVAATESDFVARAVELYR